MSPLTIRLTILRTLKLNAPYAVPFETLLAEVNRLVRPPLTAEQLTTQLRVLLDAVMIDFLADDLDPDNETARRWLIKEAGEAALKK
jgi:hypothetical protein